MLLISCNSKSDSDNSNNTKIEDGLKSEISKESDSKNRVEKTNEDSEDEYYNYNKVSLRKDYCDSISMHFSETDKNDFFTFNIPKGNINKTYSSLKITNYQGYTIFNLKFKTNELIDAYSTFDIKTDEEFVKYILEQAENVLHPDSFMNFNNLDKESYLNDLEEGDFYDYTTLEEIKKENRLIFILSREEENNIYYGYSKKQKKVIEIYACC